LVIGNPPYGVGGTRNGGTAPASEVRPSKAPSINKEIDPIPAAFRSNPARRFPELADLISPGNDPKRRASNSLQRDEISPTD
jgi:hypothetical protein